MFMRATFLLVCLGLTISANAQSEVKSFTGGSYAKVLELRSGKPFVMVFWSLDCAPCYRELAMLGELKKQQPRIELVLVSTDGLAAAEEIQILLKKMGLVDTDSWVFDNHVPERLRFEIDASWYGELPRSYLFSSDHQRQTVSGILTSNQLLSWLKIVGLGNN